MNKFITRFLVTGVLAATIVVLSLASCELRSESGSPEKIPGGGGRS
jgi:hypothetical protein